ncbi:hypothetical protein ACOJQI_02345 [Bacillus salacetis]|uniref:hypothetical protein n=1 Tax=Bacillus salacetis TaxID=2315464 RepID=UPI003BA22D52
MWINRLSNVIKAGGILLIAAGVGLMILGIFLPGETDFMNDIFEKLGTIGEYTAILAGALWLGRLVFREMKKRGIKINKYMKDFVKLLKTHHTLFGWVVTAAVLGHGLYFLLQTSEHMDSIYSGIAAGIGLIALVLIGVVLDKWAKKKKYILYRNIHKGIALLFGIALVIHLIL